MAFSFKLRRQLTNSSIKSIPRDSVEYYTLVEVQERLLKLYEDDKDIFEDSDVKKIVQSMGYLRRFAQRQDANPDKTVEMVKNTLKWRKEQKIPQICESVIPLEFYELGACFLQGTDNDGNYMLHLRAKYAIFNDKVKVAMERMFAYLLFRVVEEAMKLPTGKGWVLLADLTGISMAQYDLPEILWALKVVVNYMPAGLKSIIIYNLPWFAKPIVKVVMAFIPAEWKRIMHFVGHKELLKLIPKENIPKYIENPKDKYTAPAPADAKPVSELDVSVLDVDKEEFVHFVHNMLMKIK